MDHRDHQVVPHRHFDLPASNGKTPQRYPCSGRFWCETDRMWISRSACQGREIPGALLKLQRRR